MFEEISTFLVRKFKVETENILRSSKTQKKQKLQFTDLNGCFDVFINESSPSLTRFCIDSVKWWVISSAVKRISKRAVIFVNKPTTVSPRDWRKKPTQFGQQKPINFLKMCRRHDHFSFGLRKSKNLTQRSVNLISPSSGQFDFAKFTSYGEFFVQLLTKFAKLGSSAQFISQHAGLIIQSSTLVIDVR